MIYLEQSLLCGHSGFIQFFKGLDFLAHKSVIVRWLRIQCSLPMLVSEMMEYSVTFITSLLVDFSFSSDLLRKRLL